MALHWELSSRKVSGVVLYSVEVVGDDGEVLYSMDGLPESALVELSDEIRRTVVVEESYIPGKGSVLDDGLPSPF